MADRIYIRAWKKEENTPVADREIVFIRASGNIGIGTPDGVVEYVPKKYVDERIAELNARIDALSTPSE